VALLLPAIQAAREAARRTQCVNQVKQVVLGLQNHADTYKMFPQGSAMNDGLAWNVKILPFIEEQTLYDKFDFKVAWNAGVNVAPAITKINAYLCPSGTVDRSQQGAGSEEYTPPGGTLTKMAASSYYGNMGPNGQIPGSSPAANYTVNATPGFGGFASQGVLLPASTTRFADISDGTSKTFAVGEISWNDKSNPPITWYRSWTRGCGSSAANQGSCGMVKQVKETQNLVRYDGLGSAGNFNNFSFGSMHPGGAEYGMVDGSVKFVADTVDMNAYRAAASRNGNESLPLD
jgi:hypothetical protein